MGIDIDFKQLEETRDRIRRAFFADLFALLLGVPFPDGDG